MMPINEFCCCYGKGNGVVFRIYRDLQIVSYYKMSAERESMITINGKSEEKIEHVVYGHTWHPK